MSVPRPDLPLAYAGVAVSAAPGAVVRGIVASHAMATQDLPAVDRHDLDQQRTSRQNGLASHLLLSPEAGARFGFELVWLVLVVHLVKYPAFEFAPRYVAARGESLLDAYARAPGPKNWALWLGLTDMCVQALGLIAALVGLTASFLVAAVGGPSLTVWSLGLTGLLLAFLALGRYKALRGVNLLLLGVLILGTLVAFAAAPPGTANLGAVLRPGLPEGSLLLVAAILGFMPTSVAVSIWQSLWALEQGRFRGGSTVPKAERRLLLRRGLFDLRIGYGLSAGLAAIFVCLGATVLHPRGLVPQGTDVALTLSRLYTEVLGEWMRPVVLLMAFAALLTTCYTMMDGFPRSFVAARRALRGLDAGGGPADRGTRREYWAFLLTVTVGGMAILATVPDPAFLVKAVGAFGLLLSPIYFTLNLWAVTRLVDDPELRPGVALRTLAMVGILTMAGTAALLLWTTFAIPA
ncbi:MAG: divalent metal cation transporter [Holophagales bacterium]|nr:divalent metal cation transporter [Holophagales bacterium]